MNNHLNLAPSKLLFILACNAVKFEVSGGAWTDFFDSFLLREFAWDGADLEGLASFVCCVCCVFDSFPSPSSFRGRIARKIARPEEA